MNSKTHILQLPCFAICRILPFIFLFVTIGALKAQHQDMVPPAPLFKDPVFDGPADPTVFWNRQEKSWWMIYTQRRANSQTSGLAWVHGTAIGVASSTDGGLRWTYRGTLSFNYEPGHNTYWAPEVYWDGQKYQVFVSYCRGIPDQDFSDEHKILRYEGNDMWNLTLANTLNLDSERVIDPTLLKLPNGTYRLWFKNENQGYTTHYADSKNLVDWNPKGPAIDNTNCEGANVFSWKGKYWMITDPWYGIELYSSDDTNVWKKQGVVLKGNGQRKDDSAKGHHACVVAAGEYAYIFYHCNPEESFGPNGTGDGGDWSKIGYRQRRSVIQVARLRLEDNKVICDRDTPFPLELVPPSE